jgi:hypothetical protein
MLKQSFVSRNEFTVSVEAVPQLVSGHLNQDHLPSVAILPDEALG